MTTEGNSILHAQILNLESEVRELKEIIKRRDDNLMDMNKSVNNMAKYFKWMVILEVVVAVLSML